MYMEMCDWFSFLNGGYRIVIGLLGHQVMYLQTFMNLNL